MTSNIILMIWWKVSLLIFTRSNGSLYLVVCLRNQWSTIKLFLILQHKSNRNVSTISVTLISWLSHYLQRNSCTVLCSGRFREGAQERKNVKNHRRATKFLRAGPSLTSWSGFAIAVLATCISDVMKCERRQCSILYLTCKLCGKLGTNLSLWKTQYKPSIPSGRDLLVKKARHLLFCIVLCMT